MWFRTLLFVLPCLISFSLFSGGDNFLSGPRFSGLANASVSLSDPWSALHNQAGLAFLKFPSAGISYESRFLIAGLSMKSGVFALPLKAGTFGLSFSSFGFKPYSETKAGLAFAKSFGNSFAAGIQMDYLHFTLGEEYGTRQALVAEAGLQARLWKGLTAGAHIYNPTRTRLASYNDERIPTIMRFGMDYRFSDKVFLSIETEKELSHKADLRAGIEYRVVKELYLRAGFSTYPSLSCFGMGIELKQFRLDISSSYHAALGFNTQAGLLFEFR